MRLVVFRVTIPALSTIGYGFGKGATGRTYEFAGDHRPMRDLGQAVAQAENEDELSAVSVDDWQILNHSPRV